jgi:hypothetical protein
VVCNKTVEATREWEKKGDRNIGRLLPYQTEWKPQPGVGDPENVNHLGVGGTPYSLWGSE